MSNILISLLRSAASSLVFLSGLRAKPRPAGPTSGHPGMIPSFSSKMNRFKRLAVRICDRKAGKREEAAEELESMLSEIRQKEPKDYPCALLAASEAMAVLGNRDAQTRYLLEAEECFPDAPGIVRSTVFTDLATNYRYSFGVVADDAKAYEYLKKAYDCDTAPGAFLMGIATLCGIGTVQDFEWASRYLSESNNLQRWPLIYAINFYLDNLNSSPSIQKAWEDYIKAYELIELGHRHLEAIPYIEKAIENGFLPACQLLGDLYINYGNRHDALKAVEPAVTAGYVPAIHQKAYYIYSHVYGRMFQQKNIQLGYNLFRKAALAGYPASQICISSFHITGSGGVVKQDLPQACAFARAAADAGEPQGEQMYRTAIRMSKLKDLTSQFSFIQGLHGSNALFRIAGLQRNLMHRGQEPDDALPSQYGIQPVPPLHTLKQHVCSED